MKKTGPYLLLFTLSTACASMSALADNPLGLYVGAAFGVADVRSSAGGFDVIDHFDEHHSAWKAMLGTRPVFPVGLELAYMDLGDPGAGATDFYSIRHSKQNATALFGIGYLPLPVPFFDVYGKLGVARLHRDATQTTLPLTPGGCFAIPGCFPIMVNENQWSTDFAYGAGVQASFRALAVRVEYERIDATGGNPDVLSLGVTWTF